MGDLREERDRWHLRALEAEAEVERLKGEQGRLEKEAHDYWDRITAALAKCEKYTLTTHWSRSAVLDVEQALRGEPAQGGK